MKIEKLQLRGKKSVCAGAFHLLRGRASAQLKGNIAICSLASTEQYTGELQKSQRGFNLKQHYLTVYFSK
jgi:hypothetical protein